MRSGGIGAFEVDMPGGFGMEDSSDSDNTTADNNSPPLSPRGNSIFGILNLKILISKLAKRYQ